MLMEVLVKQGDIMLMDVLVKQGEDGYFGVIWLNSKWNGNHDC